MATPSGRVEVLVARDLAHAYIVKGLLEQEGVEVLVENESLQPLVGAVPGGWPTAPRLLVRAEDGARARAIVEREEGAAREAREGREDRG